MEKAHNKLKDLPAAQTWVAQWKQQQQRVVFTNGCFDILHLGHVSYLEEAKSLGDRLVVGLNTDQSIARIKGIHRPIQDQYSRAIVLASLQCVDLVTFFDENIPLSLISALIPDVLVKGGDYLAENIVGAEIVKRNNGVVKVLDFVDGYSTTGIMDKIKKT